MVGRTYDIAVSEGFAFHVRESAVREKNNNQHLHLTLNLSVHSEYEVC